MEQSMSRIHGWLSTGATPSRNSSASHARPVRSSMLFIARRTTSSLTAHHAQQRRVEDVAAHRVDVRIAPVPAEEGERRGAQRVHDRAAPDAVW